MIDQKEKGDNVGQGLLIHGCRNESDFAYRSKIDGALAAGALSSLLPAYSRKQDSKSVHVQDIVEVFEEWGVEWHIEWDNNMEYEEKRMEGIVDQEGAED